MQSCTQSALGERTLRMETPIIPRQLADNLWLLAYPLKLLGADFRRNVTLIRLQSGRLIVHSTAPFKPEEVESIHALGEPGWLVDGILRHDTFAREGRAAFPGIPYLAPPGFSEVVGFPTDPIVPAPEEWNDEVAALEIQGMPEARDTALFHMPSRTLILTELIFNFGHDEPVWTELMLRLGVGKEHSPGISRPFKSGVKNEAAFKDSLAELLRWDFDRIVVGHGDVIASSGREKLTSALANAGFRPGL